MKHLLAPLVVILSVAGLHAEAGPFTFDGKVMTITTDRYEIQWKNGGVISWKTFLPTERTLMSPEPQHDSKQVPSGPSLRPRGLDHPVFEYHPYSSVEPERANFRVNNNPNYRTTVVFEPTENGARLIYGKLGAKRDMSWTQEFSIDPTTGDLIVRQMATAPQGHLSGISFGIYNLDASIPLAVPAFPGNGQVWRADYHQGKLVNIGYPRFWSAGIVIGMPLSGGSFAVWSEDPHFMPKYFRNFSDGIRRSIGFEASLNFPYDNNREIEVFTWRLNTFAENWTEPAKRYRELLRRLHSIMPLADRSPSWMNRLAMIWSTNDGTVEEAAIMKAKLDPGKVVLWDFTGSTNLNGLNMRVPEYIPRDGFIERNQRLRADGFHIASYYSLCLVDAQAHPTMIRDYGLGLYYDALAGEERTDIKIADSGKEEERLIYVHPGSAQWRKFYAHKMKHVFDNYGVDLLYQDVAGTAVGSSGVVNGLNFNEAVVAGDADIHQAVPEAMIGGEYWNEVTVVHESIGLQRSIGWGGPDSRVWMSRMDTPHPICSLLFSPFSLYVGYKVPQRDGVAWHQDQNMNEVIGSIPNWYTPVDDPSPEAALTLLRAKLWADGFKPWFPTEWENGVASYMRNEAGDVVRYRRTGNQSFCTRQNKGSTESLVYGRISGVNRLEYGEPVYIQDWPAHDAKGPIGLNPSRYYCVFPGKPSELPVTIDHLPEGVFLENVRHTEDYFLATFNRTVKEGEFRWHADFPGWKIQIGSLHDVGYLLGLRAEPDKAGPEEEFSLDDFHVLTTLGGMPIGDTAPPLRRTVRWNGEPLEMFQFLPPTGGKGSEVGMEKLVTLPDAGNLGLLFASDRKGGAGDGVNLVVRVNGQEIWRQFNGAEPSQLEHSVPLGDFSGQTVLLGIFVDAGPSGYNRSNDETRIGKIRLGTVTPKQEAAQSSKPPKTPADPKIPENETYR